MAALTITASQVLTVPSGGSYEQGTAGEAVTAGQTVYLLTGQYFLADANDTLAKATVRGIALHGALAGQPLRIQVGGDITLGAGAAPVVGMVYVQASAAGGIAPATDLATTMWSSVIGVGQATNQLHMGISVTGQQIP